MTKRTHTKYMVLGSRCFWGLTLTLLVVLSLTAEASSPPNVIVIMADDMGYADAGFTGSKDIKTPHLDSLAVSGVVFRQGYVTHPFCGPSRAALMAGRYQQRFGFETNPAYDPGNPYLGIDPGEILFPKRLQKAGYRTGIIGKWHLGAAPAYHPNNRGFDHFFGFLGGGHDYFRIDLREPVQEGYLQALERNGRPAEFQGYLTTALAEDAAHFVAAEKEKPFFLYLAFNAPHTPAQAPKDDIARYAHIADKRRRVYAAMVDVMDAGIGKVIAALDENGLRENTLIFFLSDNGGPQDKEGTSGGNGSSNAPFRGGKGDLYDGGVRVPFIASWPARIPPGTKFESPVSSLDIAATAVALAGEVALAGSALDGVDLIPHLLGQKTNPPHDALFWRGDDGSSWAILSQEGYKHSRQPASQAAVLHHLPSDIGEAKNLASEESGRAQHLRQEWLKWNESNVPGRFMDYKKYHPQRDQFFLQAIPKKAVDAGYQTTPIPTIK
jgi:arylsulfatase A-like enzyme